MIVIVKLIEASNVITQFSNKVVSVTPHGFKMPIRVLITLICCYIWGIVSTLRTSCGFWLVGCTFPYVKRVLFGFPTPSKCGSYIQGVSIFNKRSFSVWQVDIKLSSGDNVAYVQPHIFSNIRNTCLVPLKTAVLFARPFVKNGVSKLFVTSGETQSMLSDKGELVDLCGQFSPFRVDTSRPNKSVKFQVQLGEFPFGSALTYSGESKYWGLRIVSPTTTSQRIMTLHLSNGVVAHEGSSLLLDMADRSSITINDDNNVPLVTQEDIDVGSDSESESESDNDDDEDIGNELKTSGMTLISRNVQIGSNENCVIVTEATGENMREDFRNMFIKEEEDEDDSVQDEHVPLVVSPVKGPTSPLIKGTLSIPWYVRNLELVLSKRGHKDFYIRANISSDRSGNGILYFDMHKKEGETSLLKNIAKRMTQGIQEYTETIKAHKKSLDTIKNCIGDLKKCLVFDVAHEKTTKQNTPQTTSPLVEDSLRQKSKSYGVGSASFFRKRKHMPLSSMSHN